MTRPLNPNIARSDGPDDDEFVDCAECQGTGQLMLPHSADQTDQCPHCAGHGWVIRKTAKPAGDFREDSRDNELDL